MKVSGRMGRLYVSYIFITVVVGISYVNACKSMTFSELLSEFGADPQNWCADPLTYVEKYIPSQCCMMNESSCAQAESILKVAESLSQFDKQSSVCYQNIISLFYYSCGCNQCPLQCGMSDSMPNDRDVVGFIVGGVKVDECEFPWMVKVNIVGIGSCGGTLIDSQHIVTAAHCTSDFDKSSLNVLVTSGKDETYYRREVTEIIQHPEYKQTADAFYNDISLLKISPPVRFSSCVRPLCLPPVDFDSLLNSKQCVAAGWGLTQENGPTSSDLQKVTLPVVNNTVCKRIFPAISEDQTFCAGYIEAGKDVCRGDSGGPLMCLVEKKWVLAGVTSFGRGCAQKAEMSAFAKVSNYLPWIQKNINLD